jgi:hypothetical protein
MRNTWQPGGDYIAIRIFVRIIHSIGLGNEENNQLGLELYIVMTLLTFSDLNYHCLGGENSNILLGLDLP